MTTKSDTNTNTKVTQLSYTLYAFEFIKLVDDLKNATSKTAIMVVTQVLVLV